MKIQHFIFSVGNNYFIDVQNEYYKYIIILLLATINNWLKVEYSVNLLPRSDISVISSEASFEVILAGEKTLTPCCPPWIVCLHDIYIRGLPAGPSSPGSSHPTTPPPTLGNSWAFPGPFYPWNIILNSVTGLSWRLHSSLSSLSCSHAQARQGGIRQKQKRLETTLETTLQTRRLTTIPLRRWVNHARRKDVDLPTGADLYLLNTSHQEADLEDQDVGRLRTNSTGSQ